MIELIMTRISEPEPFTAPVHQNALNTSPICNSTISSKREIASAIKVIDRIGIII
jgi:hypothetical protein